MKSGSVDNAFKTFVYDEKPRNGTVTKKRM